ncbi:hypothetical protein BX616_010725 [Lobosporangium transversale]|uniref:Galactose oxidase n=1 Tax=Lobosporangium transversale TaxID=64571 RepID=A0A1Y2GD77_9FUNG|nr:hypothetical protein BCR41DRAFT_361027 [Lobosporangium transversale]KAF9917976.1 hypothetical protein BX616_010725 [Lobosporangium transversale]ORZ06287.1 hypothetical protein BCR41DRAFT_361027 [Lobosporangium transversale]|eukprot:XP_021877450.1 hypothetical protein BCR41DRAFT_361027 [Lobosporangium transversale]
MIMVNGGVNVYKGPEIKWIRIMGSISFNKSPGLSAATDSQNSFVFIPNGNVEPDNTNSLLKLNFIRNEFRTVPMPQDIKGSFGYGVAWSTTARSLFVFGGTLNNITAEGLYQLNAFDTWSKPSTKGVTPPGRVFPCFVSTGDGSKIVLFGGAKTAEQPPMNDIYFLDVKSMTWTKGPDIPPAAARHSSACAISGDFFVAWGGFNGVTAISSNVTLAYNMKLNQWTTTFGQQPEPTPIATSTTSISSTATSTPSPSPNPSDDPPHWPTAVGVSVPVTVLIIVVFTCGYRRRAKSKEATREASEDTEKGAKKDNEIAKKDNGAADSLSSSKLAIEPFKPNESFPEMKTALSSQVRDPAGEGDRFGYFQRRFSTLRGPSGAEQGAYDDRTGAYRDVERDYQDTRRSPNTDMEFGRGENNSSRERRNPATGGPQPGFTRNVFNRLSQLRNPSTAGMESQHQDYHDDDDWAAYYNTDDNMDNQTNYVPPPPTFPKRVHNPAYPLPPSVSTLQRNLPTPTRRGPATYERESVFGYANSMPPRGAPQEVDWETK